MSKSVKTLDGLITALGGRRSVAALCDLRETAIIYWQEQGYIPAHRYPELHRALKRRGFEPDLSLFKWTRARTSLRKD